MTAAIAARNVFWRPGKAFALRDLSMTVPTGAIYGFLGPNGSGKTSTIRLLLGMQRPDAGEIRVLDEPIPQRASLALARIGYVPERLHLYATLTVNESIRYHRAFYPRFEETAAETLRRRFGLRGEQRVAQLSKGESGKLMTLLALSQRAELLVLDEPTDGLDPVIRRELLGALVEYVATQPATILISSHLVHEQERICDWVGVMDGGRLLAELPMEEFRSGIKRLRLVTPPAERTAMPFTLLATDGDGDGAGIQGSVVEWVVRGYQPAMREWLSAAGCEVREVIDLDLEESFVGLLAGARSTQEVA
jgi:ABC-2 type transport system ATP-binding protein